MAWAMVAEPCSILFSALRFFLPTQSPLRSVHSRDHRSLLWWKAVATPYLMSPCLRWPPQVPPFRKQSLCTAEAAPQCFCFSLICLALGVSATASCAWCMWLMCAWQNGRRGSRLQSTAVHWLGESVLWRQSSTDQKDAFDRTMKYSEREKEKGSFGVYRKKRQKREVGVTCQQKCSNGLRTELRAFALPLNLGPGRGNEASHHAEGAHAHAHDDHDPSLASTQT